MNETADLSWQCELSAQKPKCILECIKRQIKGQDSPCLFHSAETPPGVLHPGVGPSTRMTWTCHVRVGAEEGHDNGKSGTALLQGQAGKV